MGFFIPIRFLCITPKNSPAHWVSGSVFANTPGDQSSISGRFITETQKMILDSSLFNTQYNKVRFKGKMEQSRERREPFPTPWCCSY